MQDTAQALIRNLELLTAGSFGIGLVLLLLAVAYFRRSRTEAFWRFRRQASRQGFRTSIAALFFLGASAALCVTTMTIDYVETREEPISLVASATASPTPEAQLSPTAIVIIVTATPSVNEVASVATPNQPIATDTPPVEASPSPSITPTITPTPGVSINIQALDDVISDANQPIQPDETFPIGSSRLYTFFSYENFKKGDVWQQQLFKDGQLLQEARQLWGLTASTGQTFFFFGDSEGFSSGNYEIRLSYGPEAILLASAPFTIGIE